MSFVTGEDVMNCIEGLVRRLWKAMLDTELPASPFSTMTYEHAMATYGSDKPDIRLGMEVRAARCVCLDCVLSFDRFHALDICCQ